ncbi:sodium/calcium exchanger (plasmid) [Methylorubrum populi]|jgi:cation:H+ antiporter|uniref:Sodium/calcium exchanger n=1 Tax=Methylorubrum populi TaxID=223967 RepID=A0A160PLF3_9HYPH|nr:calcium/sodium antiporter [Methylorubrum populi]OAH18530.1 sodium:calcium antiporter [Methylorubrum populi]BAU94046.1 sodium/calcium exchanger [Methylorubrum populi]
MDVALSILGGLALLVLGGEFLVRGAVQLAERMGVSPLLIGLTLVGFGTSTPELVTSVQAALIGSSGIAVGNIVGSNIANILLILGLAALISPIAVPSGALKRDGVLVVATAALLALVGWTLALERWVGALFVAGLVAYIVYAWRQERVGGDGHTAAFEKAEAFEAVHAGVHQAGASAPKAGLAGVALSLAFALGGLALVVLGGGYLVEGAIALAQRFGISETVIGLTIVAVGTSMPEFVTSVVAAIRRQSDVALGNVLGSNIYNILGIGGLTALIAPTAVPPEIARFDNLVMLAVSGLLLAFAWTGLRIGRREGAALVLGYGLYVWAIWPT